MVDEVIRVHLMREIVAELVVFLDFLVSLADALVGDLVDFRLLHRTRYVVGALALGILKLAFVMPPVSRHLVADFCESMSEFLKLPAFGIRKRILVDELVGSRTAFLHGLVSLLRSRRIGRPGHLDRSAALLNFLRHFLRACGVEGSSRHRKRHTAVVRLGRTACDHKECEKQHKFPSEKKERRPRRRESPWSPREEVVGTALLREPLLTQPCGPPCFFPSQVVPIFFVVIRNGFAGFLDQTEFEMIVVFIAEAESLRGGLAAISSALIKDRCGWSCSSLGFFWFAHLNFPLVTTNLSELNR